MFPQRRQSLAELLRLVLVGLALQACIGQECDTHGQTAQRYSAGHTNAQRSFYESSPADGPYLFFPAGRTYRFEHHLSEAPSDYDVFVSWDERPLHGSGFAPAAGNEAVFELMDKEVVQVRNDTCAELFMRLVARVAPFEQPDAAVPLSAPRLDASPIAAPDAATN